MGHTYMLEAGCAVRANSYAYAKSADIHRIDGNAVKPALAGEIAKKYDATITGIQ